MKIGKHETSKKDIRRGARVALAVAAVAGAFYVAHLLHVANVERQNTAVSVELAAQGITSTGAPNVAAGTVPVFVSPGCAVQFDIANPSANYAAGSVHVTLSLPYRDGSGRLIGQTDVMTNSASESAVRASVVATLKANPSNQICAGA